MPQLDRIIIFTQLFWLFIVFGATYLVLITFFLPMLIKLFRTRKLFIQFTLKEIDRLHLSFSLSQQVTIKILSKSFNILGCFLHSKSNYSRIKSNYFILSDSQSFSHVLRIILYCSKSLLNLTSFSIKNYNFIFK